MKYFLVTGIAAALFLGCNTSDGPPRAGIDKASLSSGHAAKAQPADTFEVHKSEKEWKALLSSSEYRILRNRGTELPFVNEYYDNKEEGVYYCGACGQPVFTSKTKYESGTGWPSYWKPIKPSVVETRKDESFFMTRTEVVCSRCGSHLGHVFKDGPEPTGLRYCLNSLALDFVKMDLSTIEVKELPVRKKVVSNN